MRKAIDEVTREQLIADFKTVVADAEALLKATANHGGDELAEVRARAQDSLKIVKASMDDAQVALLDKTREAAEATDAYVHQNPWQVAGIAAGVGLVLGLLSGRH